MKEHLFKIINVNNFIFKKKKKQDKKKPINIVLIGGGIMSATLGIYLKIIKPNWKINMYERLKDVGEESSNGWNNAGTGHAAFCELNYTNLTNKNTIDISKAIKINESFAISLQLWSFLIKNKILKDPKKFINNVPHMSFVWNNDNINFLKKRYNTLKTSNLFKGMIYSEDINQIKKWAPLIINGRNNSQKIAATYMKIGTDVNYGEITKQLLKNLKKNINFNLYTEHNVTNIKRNKDKTWCLNIINNKKEKIKIKSNYVFIGSGGGSLKLLQKSNIPEMNNFAGFPVGGQFLVATNPKVIYKHYAKVYGKAPLGAPPMSVPHIDTRILNGKQVLLFGPFATFSTKFLKNGQHLDLIYSLTKKNILPLMHAGIDNIKLINYLIKQLLMSDQDRLNALRKYYPLANYNDWTLITAGQRVQVIKKDKKKGGILQFGTETVSSADGSLLALLGASPGASTAASIAIKILEIIFKKKKNKEKWKEKIKKIIPSYNKKLNGNILLTNSIRYNTSKILNLNYI